MKDINKILTIILIGLSLGLLYMMFTGGSKLNEAIKIISNVRDSVIIVKDSLSKAQNSIQNILKKVEFSENELKILKAQRDLLELEELKKRAENWEIHQKITKEIEDNENKRDTLIKKAKKFNP